MNCLSSIKCCVILLLFGLNTIGTDYLYAQQDSTNKKYYLGIEMGAGGLQLFQNNVEGETTVNYELGFYGGYILSQKLKLGINLNGYLIEPFGSFYESPEKGISISNIHAQLQATPFRKENVFTNIQGGWSTYTNHHPDNYNSKGISGKVGLGYEHGFGKRLFVSLLFNYSAGKFDDVIYPGISVTNQHFNAYEIVAGLTYK